MQTLLLQRAVLGRGLVKRDGLISGTSLREWDRYPVIHREFGCLWGAGRNNDNDRFMGVRMSTMSVRVQYAYVGAPGYARGRMTKFPSVTHLQLSREYSRRSKPNT